MLPQYWPTSPTGCLCVVFPSLSHRKIIGGCSPFRLGAGGGWIPCCTASAVVWILGHGLPEWLYCLAPISKILQMAGYTTQTPSCRGPRPFPSDIFWVWSLRPSGTQIIPYEESVHGTLPSFHLENICSRGPATLGTTSSEILTLAWDNNSRLMWSKILCLSYSTQSPSLFSNTLMPPVKGGGGFQQAIINLALVDFFFLLSLGEYFWGGTHTDHQPLLLQDIQFFIVQLPFNEAFASSILSMQDRADFASLLFAT